jgi:hypothetical protein
MIGGGGPCPFSNYTPEFSLDYLHTFIHLKCNSNFLFQAHYSLSSMAVQGEVMTK